MAQIKRLQYFVDGQWKDSKTEKYMPVYNPSTGEVIAEAPCCTAGEVEEAIESAKAAFPAWSNTPVMKRVQVLYKFRELLIANMDELAKLCATEHGKVLGEAKGDILKVKEPVELALSAPSLLLGDAMRDTSSGYDTTLYYEPVGVFAGIVPFNFPGMIPMGWMVPCCIAAGNTIVLKLASMTPMTAMRLNELLVEAGLPKGVVNLVTCSRVEADLLLKHPDVKGITFVGSTKVGLHVYKEASATGKRVQCLCEAKNHALVLEDAALERTARGIINSSFG
ncbi:MAG: aldehyde dehydrogenase family protein, partial [Oscillospiraceae bacterium]|nr:aldehyde dehydrogenase family protein [Oscillospiraceae bacterium]